MISKPLDKSLSTLIREADAVFSKYIRTKHSVGGVCMCFICGRRMKIAEAQCGHYIGRDKVATRYEEMNCRPVCNECNCYDIDHVHKFKLKLLDVLTPEGLEHLHAKSRSLAKFMRHELIEIIDTYKAKLKELNR